MKTGIGQDSHRFHKEKNGKKCIIAGIHFEETPGWEADSDGDIVYHSICNAISSITNVPILGKVAIKMCKEDGITDSSQFLLRANETLGNRKIIHVALSIEALRPKLQPSIDRMRANIAKLLKIEVAQVGITCTSGDGLTDFGKGLGGQCLCVLTVS